ncbi:hypothetical protein BHM03_00062159, partial [Ensete ventricosum]
MQVLPTAPSPTVTHFINLDALISSSCPFPPQKSCLCPSSPWDACESALLAASASTHLKAPKSKPHMRQPTQRSPWGTKARGERSPKP